MKRVDRERAAEIAKPYWKRLTKGLEYSDTFGALCVRSRTDVACGQYQLNRLVGKTWVYATIGRGPDDVLVDGRPIRGFSSQYSGVALFVIPDRAKQVAARYEQQDGATFTATSERPDI